MKKATRATAFKFLRERSVAVLATVGSGGWPSTTPIMYVVTADRKLRFVTKDQTTKFRNLSSTDKIALSVVDGERMIAVNISGQARIISELSDMSSTLRAIGSLAKTDNPLPVIKHQLGDYVVVEIDPKHMQYADYSSTSPQQKTFTHDL